MADLAESMYPGGPKQTLGNAQLAEPGEYNLQELYKATKGESKDPYANDLNGFLHNKGDQEDNFIKKYGAVHATQVLEQHIQNVKRLTPNNKAGIEFFQQKLSDILGRQSY